MFAALRLCDYSFFGKMRTCLLNRILSMKKNIEQVFQESLDDLQVDAKAAGMNLTTVCKAAGIARATPDRWRQNPPKTIRALAKMQDVVADATAQETPAATAEESPKA